MFKDMFPFSEFSRMDIVSPVCLNGRSYSPAIGLLKSEISYISVYFSAEMGVS